MKKRTDYIIIGKQCKIARSARIMTGSVIGKRFRQLLDGKYDKKDYPTQIGKKVHVGYYCLIGNGSAIGDETVIDDMSIIESDVKIGNNSLLIYRAQLCNDVKVGNNTVIGGFIGERTEIGNDCRVFGSIVHSQSFPENAWDDDESEEGHVTIMNKVFVGFNAVLAGKIKIGPNAYVIAGSLITRDVPSGYIACGRNQLTHYSEWKGKLKESNLFR